MVETAARRADWYFLPPGGLETMKSVAIRKDVWRDEGAGYLRKGPFPKEKTSVLVSRIGRNDTTGRVVFQVSAKHGDRVYYEEDGSPATINSPVVQGGRLETTALKVSFLAIDSTGEHETGESREETNPITLKYDYAYRDGARRITLKAVPLGTIRYTLDGSNPRNGGVCDAGEVIVPDGHDLLLTVAEAQGSGRSSCAWTSRKQAPGITGIRLFSRTSIDLRSGVIGSALATAAARSRSSNA